MIYFCTIIIMLIVLMAVCTGVYSITGNGTKDVSDASRDFITYTGFWYQVILGENPSGN